MYFDQSFVEETRNFSFDLMAHCKTKPEIDGTPLHFATLNSHSKNCHLSLLALSFGPISTNKRNQIFWSILQEFLKERIIYIIGCTQFPFDAGIGHFENSL